jgi:hypothetical protein
MGAKKKEQEEAVACWSAAAVALGVTTGTRLVVIMPCGKIRGRKGLLFTGVMAVIELSCGDGRGEDEDDGLLNGVMVRRC